MDPRVLEERDIVLGEDRSAANDWIGCTRTRLVEAYKNAFHVLECNVKLLHGYTL